MCSDDFVHMPHNRMSVAQRVSLSRTHTNTHEISMAGENDRSQAAAIAVRPHAERGGHFLHIADRSMILLFSNFLR